MKNLFKKLSVFTLVLFILSGCQFFSRPSSGIIRISGSDTMLSLCRELAITFMQNHPGISVYTEGGGSAVGLSALAGGETDIAMASRVIVSREAMALAEKYRTIGVSHLIAKDALSIYLNESNPVNNLSLQELQDIFSGRIYNWSQVGGEDARIEVLIRPPTSGTYLYFKDHVLEGEPYTQSAVTMPTNQAISDYIRLNPRAIGFGGIAFGDNLQHCSIEQVAPTEENVRNDLYPLSRYLYFYTKDIPVGNTKRFIDWCLTPSGQQVIQKAGYVPLWPTNLQ